MPCNQRQRQTLLIGLEHGQIDRTMRLRRRNSIKQGGIEVGIYCFRGTHALRIVREHTCSGLHKHDMMSNTLAIVIGCTDSMDQARSLACTLEMKFHASKKSVDSSHIIGIGLQAMDQRGVPNVER